MADMATIWPWPLCHLNLMFTYLSSVNNTVYLDLITNSYEIEMLLTFTSAIVKLISLLMDTVSTVIITGTLLCMLAIWSIMWEKLDLYISSHTGTSTSQKVMGKSVILIMHLFIDNSLPWNLRWLCALCPQTPRLHRENGGQIHKRKLKRLESKCCVCI